MPDSLPAPRHVFVYGTLRAGGSNDIARFSPAPLRIADGVIAGTLYDLGAYPGAVLGGEGRVQGEIYRITPALEAQLDVLEEIRPDDSGEYIKREVQVPVAGVLLGCLVYEIHPDRIAGRAPIASGDWFRRA
ncbi:gamma-glutamylcyclotransferase family protein [Variovorax saccharolyticus]|uniref:gamma-glutamylcyclotransferase family protein n=1 Tax=Variovorax saccharolyticus TaxID=3053516 RepID=UPI002578E394|nr:gamma-glutamylcyclotransferase family protein [Variovorax sp. J22R187]MDM0016618.1 gamma-glutamylcyclotransferase family protein [Variovorax sp. J22R187]